MTVGPPHGTRGSKLLRVAPDGSILHGRRTDLAALLRPGDLVVANDAATLPASLHGHAASDAAPIEIRLAAWLRLGDVTRFVAVLFGAGDHRTRTEDRPPPPRVEPGDILAFGPLIAVIERVLGHPRLVIVRFAGKPGAIRAGLAGHGRPIQYAHVREPLKLWDVWTKVAAAPIAFEPPSAGFALDWRTIADLRRRGIGFATLSLAAGLSSTGDPALDRLFPLDEAYRVPEATAAAIRRTKEACGRIVAVGTTVVRALESAARARGLVRAGEGVATGRIGQATRLRIVDAILTGVHAEGESHYELLRAFAPAATLQAMTAAAGERRYRNHEFGDFVLLERAERKAGRRPAARTIRACANAGSCYSTTPMIGP